MEPDLAAEKVLDDLDIHHVDIIKNHLESIVWYRRQALVTYEPLHGAEARLCTIGDRAIIRISDQISFVERRRFGIAHELGHLELHSSSSIHIDKNLSPHRLQKKEREANKFASSLLMPSRFFLPEITGTPRLETVEKLKNLFFTSWTATALRLIDLCSEPMAVVYANNRKILWSKESESLKEMGIKVKKSGDLHIQSVACDVTDKVRLPHRVREEFWISSQSTRIACHVSEHSWHLGNGKKLTLLRWDRL